MPNQNPTWHAELQNGNFIAHSAKSPAQAKPAGPEPITATFLSRGGGREGATPFLHNQLKMPKYPMATGCPLLPSMHLSHWSSWGHTLPHIAGRLFFLYFSNGPSNSPCDRSLIKPGISISTGHPSIQVGFLH